MIRALFLIISSTILLGLSFPELKIPTVLRKTGHILSWHASQQDLNPSLMQRIFEAYLEHLDPLKIYFTQEELAPWLHAEPSKLKETVKNFEKGDFSPFFTMHDLFVEAVKRRQVLITTFESALSERELTSIFKEEWAKDLPELKELTLNFLANLNSSPDLQGKPGDKLLKGIREQEEAMTPTDPEIRKNLVHAFILKGVANGLDYHTNYFTPEDVLEFQEYLAKTSSGIGIITDFKSDGLLIKEILQGGPASKSGLLAVDDKIIAVDGTFLSNLDYEECVDLIKGTEGTPVILTILRGLEEEPLEVEIVRGEVTREGVHTSVFPSETGVIAVLKLDSFYEDERGCSATKDLRKGFEGVSRESQIRGVILDLRDNPGGLMTEAIGVASLFTKKGIICITQDENGELKRFRNAKGEPLWKGPLVILVDRGSASASELVAQSLQDYGRAIVVGDDRTFGKGCYQSYTFNFSSTTPPNPEGELAVTGGLYYAVSGKSPQYIGVIPDIFVPGPLSLLEIGEKYYKFTLGAGETKPLYYDNLSDLPPLERLKDRFFYKNEKERKIDFYKRFIPTVQKIHRTDRERKNDHYQKFIPQLRDNSLQRVEGKTLDHQSQLEESVEIMKDLIELIEKASC